jgi:CheY-like chemotaxis protein
MKEKISGKPFEILLAEDNHGDVRLIEEILKKNKVPINLHVMKDGIEALSFLKRKGKHINALHPDLVLLDLNLPKKEGLEVLKEIKGDPDLKRIPVIILTTSGAEEDVLKSYQLHANCYITKPINLDQFVTVVKSIENFWLTIVKLPPR